MLRTGRDDPLIDATRTSSIVIGVLGVAVVALAIFTVIQIGNLNSKVNDLEDTTAGLESATASGGRDAAIHDFGRMIDYTVVPY